jgi:hypothetical protein
LEYSRSLELKRVNLWNTAWIENGDKLKTHPRQVCMLEVSFAHDKMTKECVGFTLKSVDSLSLSSPSVIAGFIKIIQAGMLRGRAQSAGF